MVGTLWATVACQPKSDARAAGGLTKDARDASLPAPGTCSNATLLHATVYPAPHQPVVENATIEIDAGKVARVFPGEPETLPGCAIDADGRVVVAGFWNNHVHFTDPVFDDSASEAQARLDTLLLRHGFTSVLDTGADIRVLTALRDRIADGTLRGPRIVVAGGSFVPENGTPSYVTGITLPEISDPAAAEDLVATTLQRADGIKIFSGSYQTPDYTIYMEPEVIAAITQAAHDRDAFVVSHPTDLEGLINALDNGVDVLAHTAPPAGRLSADVLEHMKERGMALIPTLKLWRYELDRSQVPAPAAQEFIDSGVQQLADYHASGGEVLFGTDVGYMTDDDTTEEFELMAAAGLGFHDILATLTTNPAQRFTDTQGSLSPGEPADLVMLSRDPTSEVTALAEIELVIRDGHVIYSR